MDWHQLWSDYQTLIVAIVSAIATMLATQILPWFWKNIVVKVWVFIARHSGSRWRTRSFRKSYLNWLIEENRYLEIRGLRTRTPISIELEDVYVSLKAKSTLYPQSDLLKKSDSGTANEHESIPVLKALVQNKRVVILGHPGSGKTTLLRFLAVTFARFQRAAKHKGDNRKLLQKRLDGYWGLRRNKFLLLKTNEIPIPLYISLRTITIDEISDLSALNKCFVGRYFKNDYPNDFVTNILQDGKCIVFFDGLDEVKGNEVRRKIVEWIEELVAHYPENQYVVTSRIVGYSTPLAGGFKTLTLEDFNDEDITRFIQAWYQIVETHSKEQNPIVLYKAQESADALVHTILDNRKIRDLAVNPLMLSIIALVHRYRTKLPERRVDLYDECTQVLLGYWDEAKGIAGDLPPVKKRLVLEPLAYKMQMQNSFELTSFEIEQILESELPKIGGTKNDTKDFVDEIRERSGLLVERGPDVFSFSHLTFQEYLSATHVSRNRKEALLFDHVNDDRWHEVILLYSGMTDVSDFIKTLLSKPDDIFHSRLLLAGRCITEALKIDADIRRTVAAQLQELLFTCQFKACRTTIASVLQRLDPQATMKLLLKKLEDSDMSHRINLIEILSYFTDYLTEEACLKLLNNADINSRVMMLRALTKRNTLSGALAEAVVKQISDNDTNVSQRAISCLHNKSQYTFAYKALTQNLLFSEKASVRSTTAEVLENYHTYSSVLAYIGLGIFDSEGRVAIASGNTLLHLSFNLKWYRIVLIALKSFLEAVKFLTKSGLRYRTLCAISAGIAIIIALISVLPLYPILPVKRETQVLKLIRHFYWYFFWFITFLAKPFLLLLSMPKEELNFYTSFYRSLLGPVLKDERAVILIRPYIKKYSTKYQFILLHHPILYNAKPTSELIEDLKEIFYDTPSDDDKWAVANVLKKIAPDKALQLFADFSEKSNSVETKAVALNAFLLMEENLDDNYIHVIQQSLKSESPALRSMACFVLGSLRYQGCLHILNQLTNDENIDVKSSACQALSRIGSPESISFLETLLSDTNEEIRDVAYDALWQICRQNSIELKQSQISGYF